MIEERIKAALKKLETRHDSIPEDERVGDNPDYAKLCMVIAAVKQYQVTITKISETLTKFGV